MPHKGRARTAATAAIRARKTIYYRQMQKGTSGAPGG